MVAVQQQLADGPTAVLWLHNPRAAEYKVLAFIQSSGDGGNRTRVRNNYLKTSTSLVAECFSAEGSLDDADPTDDPIGLGQRYRSLSAATPSV